MTSATTVANHAPASTAVPVQRDAIVSTALTSLDHPQPATGSGEEPDQASIDALMNSLDVEEYVPADEVLGQIVESQTSFEQTATPGEFSAAQAAFESAVAEIDAHLASDPSASVSDLIDNSVIDQTSSSGSGLVTVAKRCVTVYKWQLQAVAWVAIFDAATISIVGLFATSTIAGAPAGVVLGALGIGLGASGTFVLWVVDKIRWNSKKICW